LGVPSSGYDRRWGVRIEKLDAMLIAVVIVGLIGMALCMAALVESGRMPLEPPSPTPAPDITGTFVAAVNTRAAEMRSDDIATAVSEWTAHQTAVWQTEEAR